jgi:hypothetical protein
MKSLVCLILASGAFCIQAVGFAQSTAPVTRAQVRAELIQLEQAGYHVGDGDQTTYPVQIQAAEAKVAAQDSQQMANNAVGGTTNSISASGSPMHLPKPSPSSCVGPASYCSVFFGN